MALINTIIGNDYFQLIRDKIAEILLIELANQAELSEDTELGFTQIWRERRRAFNLSELPAINLSIAGLQYADKHNGQRKTDVTFNIDIYNAKVFESVKDADELVMDNIYNITRVVQYILDHSAYRTLGLAPYIYHTEVTKVTPGEAETTEGGRCGILRIEFSVNTVSLEDPMPVIALALSNTTVKIEQTNNGFYYQLQN